MSLVATRDGVRQLLKTMLGASPVEPLLVKLFQNEHTPRREDSLDDFDEFTGHGYMPKRLEPSDWRVVMDRSGRVVLEAVAVVWTFDADMPTTAYGYYVVGANTNILYWAELLRSHVEIRVMGERLRIIPRVELRARN